MNIKSSPFEIHIPNDNPQSYRAFYPHPLPSLFNSRAKRLSIASLSDPRAKCIPTLSNSIHASNNYLNIQYSNIYWIVMYKVYSHSCHSEAATAVTSGEARPARQGNDIQVIQEDCCWIRVLDPVMMMMWFITSEGECPLIADRRRRSTVFASCLPARGCR